MPSAAARWRSAFAAHVTPRRALLALILAAAAAVRLQGIGAGVPHAVGIDEPAVIDRALRIVRSGDWNPHVFDYPTLVIYLHAFVALVRFMLGASRGEWISLTDFDLGEVYLASRAVTALLGAATVWLVYRIGRDAGSERIGLVAAAELAVLPLHVRESHFALTDTPLTALTTLALYLAMRGEGARYWLPAAVAGLAAGAKYNGGIALIAALVAVVQHRAPLLARARMLGVAIAAAVLAFLVTTPYAVLDLPTFLNSFAAQMSRFGSGRPLPEPAWMIYAKHLALAARLWLPFAAVGIVALVVRPNRARWLPLFAFAAAYSYVLGTHPLVFARYALPLTPVVCILAAAGIDGLARLASRVKGLRRRTVHAAVVAVLLALLIVPFARSTVAWLRMSERRDTRQMAADWMRASLPRGARVAVENSGPTYLNAAGFEVIGVELLPQHPIEWYLERKVQYLVVSSGVGWSEGYAAAGPRMLDVPSTPDRSGPAIRVVQLQ